MTCDPRLLSYYRDGALSFEERYEVEDHLRECQACTDGLRGLMSHKIVGDVRGKGLLIGVELVWDRMTKEQLDPAQIAAVVEYCRDRGVIVGRAGGGRRFGTTIALCPPLVITRSECDRIVETLDRALSAAQIN